MKVAFVFPGLPRRPGGAFLAGLSQARAVGLLHEAHVVVLGESDGALRASFRRQLPAEVHYVQGAPRTVDRQLRGVLTHLRADVVQVESLAGAEWISDPPSLGPRTVFRAYDATFSVVERSVRSSVNAPGTAIGHALERIGLRRPLLALSALRLRHREIGAARRFDRVLCFSNEDREIFERQGLPAGFVPLPMDPSPQPHRPEPAQIFRMTLVASFTYFPNIDALAYLLSEIVPALPRDLAWQLDVAGEAPPPFALSAGGDRVRVLGYVDDLGGLLGATDAFLVPLRFGGGVKLKTMTALARGIPTISSAVGCTGLSVRDGEHLLIRDTAAGFAAAVGTLAADPPLRVKLGEAGRRLIAEEHTPRRIAKALSVEYEAILGRTPHDQRSH